MTAIRTQQFGCRRATVLAGLAAICLAAPAASAEPEAVRIAYLGQAVARTPPLSPIETVAEDPGIQGARLALADNNTTGRFTNQAYELEEAIVPADGDPVAAFRRLAPRGLRLFLADLPAPAQHPVVDARSFEVEDCILVGQRVWNVALSADESRLYTANGISNDVAVIDVARRKATKSITVGRMPWGVVVRP